MKTSQIARGIVGALSLAGVMGMVGCGAGYEDDSTAENEIGSVDQALGTVSAAADLKDATLPNGTGITDPIAREWAASCLVTFNSAPAILLYGGYDNAGTPNGLDETYLYTGSGQWLQMDSLATDGFSNEARGEAKFLKVSATECVLIGGRATKTGAMRPNVYKFNVATNAWSASGTLNAGRVKHQVARCGSDLSKIIVFGGQTATGLTPISGVNAIETLSGTTWTARDTAGTAKLGTPIHSFGLAVKDGQSFVVAGGHDGTGGIADVVSLTANSDCSVITQADTDVLTDNASNNQSRFGNVAFYHPSSGKVVVAAGDSGGALPTHAEVFSLTAGALARTGAITGMTGVRYPALAVDDPTTPTDWALIGGEGTGAAPLAATPSATAQDFELSAGVVVKGTATNPATLSVARLGAAAEFLSSTTKFYAITGMSAQTNTLRSTVDQFAP